MPTVASTSHSPAEGGFTPEIPAKYIRDIESSYEGPHITKVSKNLKSAIENPAIVSSNLEKEVALGHTAGPFTSPPFANLQVSPIGIVPKKHMDKFHTIFHLSFPKSSSSINVYRKGRLLFTIYKDR